MTDPNSTLKAKANAAKVIQAATSKVKISNPIVDAIAEGGNKTKAELAAVVAKVSESEIKETAIPDPVVVDSLEHQKIVAETMQTAQLFQQYNCSKPSMRMITKTGKRLSFTKFELLTQDEDIVAYLDEEIRLNPRLGIVKGALMTAADKDPMAALKRAAVAEYIAKQRQEAADKLAGISRNLATTAGASNIGAANSGHVAN